MENMKWLLEEYAQRKTEIKKRLGEFKEVPEEEWFYELCFCLLTPGSRALMAHACVEQFKLLEFKHKDVDIHSYIRHMRFHNNRNRYLQGLKKAYPLVHHQLKTEKNSVILRNWLAVSIDGIGLKESSHFLRNIGHRDLAIIDRHVLTGLKNAKVISHIPTSLSNKTYLILEERFKDFAQQICIPMEELDILFWSMQTGMVFK